MIKLLNLVVITTCVMTASVAAAQVAQPTVAAARFQSIRANESATNDRAALLASDILGKNETRLQTIDLALAPIHSAGDLAEYLFAHRAMQSPLNALSGVGRQIFISSLTFNEKGITGFRYDVLESHTPTEIHKILSLFGVQRFVSRIPRMRIATGEFNSEVQHPTQRSGAGAVVCAASPASGVAHELHAPEPRRTLPDSVFAQRWLGA